MFECVVVCCGVLWCVVVCCGVLRGGRIRIRYRTGGWGESERGEPNTWWWWRSCSSVRWCVERRTIRTSHWRMGEDKRWMGGKRTRAKYSGWLLMACRFRVYEVLTALFNSSGNSRRIDPSNKAPVVSREGINIFIRAPQSP